MSQFCVNKNKKKRKLQKYVSSENTNFIHNKVTPWRTRKHNYFTLTCTGAATVTMGDRVTAGKDFETQGKKFGDPVAGKGFSHYWARGGS